MKNLAYALGLFNPKTGEIINMTTHPTNIPFKYYEEVKNIQKTLNELFLNISNDIEEFKFEDDMFKLLKYVRRKDNNQRIKTFFIRSDYLLDKVNEDKYIFRQVEINMISQCFVMFGPIVNRIHKFYNPKTIVSDVDTKFIRYLCKLKEVYEKTYNLEDTAVLMIDNDLSISSSNFLEKKKIIYHCKEKGIRVHHVRMLDLNDCFQGDNIIFQRSVVSIVYYRWFYNLEHYDDFSIETRKKIENSNAISLPSADFQIINSKLFQKLYSNKDFLKRYIQDYDKIIPHLGEFAEPENVDNIDDWVLKNVGEGGGNNVFSNVKKDMCDEKHVLMKKYNSMVFDNKFLKDEKERKVIPEISVFGSIISVDNSIIHNSEDGYIIRTKDSSSDEGGVCIGSGALDSIVGE